MLFLCILGIVVSHIYILKCAMSYQLHLNLIILLYIYMSFFEVLSRQVSVLVCSPPESDTG